MKRIHYRAELRTIPSASATLIIVSSSWQNDAYENISVIPAKGRNPAGMQHSRLWIPAFAGMTEMDQTMIKASPWTKRRSNLKIYSCSPAETVTHPAEYR